MSATAFPFLPPGSRLPDPSCALGEHSPAPGLLAAGADLSVVTLTSAYHQGIFPWFSEGQPILWWCPDPRMVLSVDRFRYHRSLRKTVSALRRDRRLQVRIDHDFRRTIQACAASTRRDQDGTWIVDTMVEAYCELHRCGLAHSVETWMDGEFCGGLYTVGIGRMVYGESMVSLRRDASKVALTALVGLCLSQQVEAIDCQQHTDHLAHMGAAEIPRDQFLAHVRLAVQQPAMLWPYDATHCLDFVEHRQTP